MYVLHIQIQSLCDRRRIILKYNLVCDGYKQQFKYFCSRGYPYKKILKMSFISYSYILRHYKNAYIKKNADRGF